MKFTFLYLSIDLVRGTLLVSSGNGLNAFVHTKGVALNYSLGRSAVDDGGGPHSGRGRSGILGISEFAPFKINVGVTREGRRTDIQEGRSGDRPRSVKGGPAAAPSRSPSAAAA